MNFEKLKDSCGKIKMPSDMKKRIKDRCNAVEAPEAEEKPHRRLDGRLIAACACCFLVLLGIGLKHSGAFDKKLPIAPDTATQTEKEETTLLDFFSNAESAVIQIIETTFTSSRHKETSVSETQLSTTQPVIPQTETTRAEETGREQGAETGGESVNSDDVVQGVPPWMLDMRDLERLKKAKNAAETMNEEDYRAFLNENQYDDIEGCFYTPEEYLKFTESELYIPIIDEDIAETSVLRYTPDYKDIDVIIRFNETDRFRFYINVSGKEESYCRDSHMFRYEKTIQRENATADVFSKKRIYKEEWAWDGFAVDLVVDGQEMSIRTNEEMTIEEFEEYFALIEFVKIKDWIGK